MDTSPDVSPQQPALAHLVDGSDGGAVRRPVFVALSAAMLAGVLVVTLAAGCDRGASRVTPTALVDATGRHPLAADVLAGTTKADALFDGCLRLVGVTAPTSGAVGARVSLALFFLVERACAQSEARVFVHAQLPGAEVNQATADHALPGGGPSGWRAGDLLVDRFELTVPAELAGDALVVRAGVVAGSKAKAPRWSVTPATMQDGQQRVEIARLAVLGAPPVEVTATARKRRSPLVIDGVLDEPDWERAARLGPFRAWDGKSAITRPTSARVLWDDDALYVAFEATDPDPFIVYEKHDDPLYESEALEIFVDADGDRDVYVELQSAANDVHFEAAFAGGRRKNMDRSYDPSFATKTRHTDVGLTSEWRIPVAELKDVPPGEPKVGATWRINLFRLERVRRGDRVERSEASAWSSPLSGDFHNLDRFGVLTFAEERSAE